MLSLKWCLLIRAWRRQRGGAVCTWGERAKNPPLTLSLGTGFIEPRSTGQQQVSSAWQDRKHITDYNQLVNAQLLFHRIFQLKYTFENADFDYLQMMGR